MVAHSVIEELLIYLCNQQALASVAFNEILKIWSHSGNDDYSEEWIFDMFDNMENIITFLYFDYYLTEGHPFHFSNWSVQQFYMDSDK